MSDTESGFTFVWKIENFSMLPHQLGDCLDSPKFMVNFWKKVDFCLRLYPRGETVEEELGLFLCKDPEDLDLKVNFTFAIESAELSEEMQGSIKEHVLKKSWGFPSFINLDDIHAETKHYLPQDTLTIRCEITPAMETSTEFTVNQESKPDSLFLKKYCFSRTCVPVQRRSITWSVRNVKERIGGQESTSILLTSALKNSPSLKLILNFNKITRGDDIPITIKHTNILSERGHLFVKCKITVISTHEEYQVSKTDSHLFTSVTSDMWYFPPFIATSMLKDEKYFDADLLLRCEFAFSYEDDVHHFENNCMPYNFKTRQENSELSTCFETLYGSGKFCDIELKAGGRTFPYYKLVLCARSSVFSAMFENDMKEKESNVVEIEDVDPDTLDRMLTYMHSDVLPEDLSAEDACGLYRVADKYDMASLKKRCSVLLANSVSLLNVRELLILADAHQDNFLMTIASDFICSHAAEVFHSPKWESLMEENPTLSCKVMHKVLTGKSQFLNE